MTEPTQRHTSQLRNAVRRVLWITLLLNLGVVLLKLGVGLANGSVSVIADAVHSLTDSANNILALYILRLSSAPPDKEHPYGHQKYEAIGALAIAALLAIASFEILQTAAVRASRQDFTALTLAPWEWFTLLLVLGTNIGVATLERRAGKRLQSSLLLADAEHTQGDIWITLGILFGLFCNQQLGWAWMDVALAVPVAALVLYSGWKVLQRNLPWLLDASAVPASQIRDRVNAIPDVVGCHDITTRGMPGQQIYIELHVQTRLQQLSEAHQLAENIRAQLEQQYAPARVTVHLEPAI